MFSKKEVRNLIVDGIGDTTILLLEDEISFENIYTSFLNEHRSLTPEAEKFVNDNFDKLKTKDPRLFNGTIFGLSSVRVENRRIYIDFEKSEYKYFEATKTKEYLKYIEEGNYFTLPISVIGLIITKDKKVFFCCPSPRNFYKINGGYCDESDLINNKLDTRNTFFRETREELGELNLYQEKVMAVGKIEHWFLLLACAKTEFTSKEVVEIRKQNEGKLEDIYETENLTFVDNTAEDISKFFTKNKNKMDLPIRYAIAYYLKGRFNNYNHINVK
ncbi:MAG: hypothetical protein LBG48_05425 [Rickettsiales bacterium]|jgi:hypothetical protein|nr:hypothetical protein [Rickettsiales bacterium]